MVLSLSGQEFGTKGTTLLFKTLDIIAKFGIKKKDTFCASLLTPTVHVANAKIKNRLFLIRARAHAKQPA